MQGGIEPNLYGERLSGGPPTVYNDRGNGSKMQIIFNRALLTSMQLPEQGSQIHIMAAFMRDGILIPLQQPVELKAPGIFYTRYFAGWPGRANIIRGTRMVGCSRWLPHNVSTHGAQAGEPTGLPSGASGGPVDSNAAMGCSNCSGCTAREFAPGLLVVELESQKSRRSSSRAAAQAGEGAQVAAGHGGGSMQRGAQQGGEEEEQELDRSGSGTDLAAVVSRVTPFYAEDRPASLQLPLPYHLASRFSLVLLELSGVRLPAWVTKGLRTARRDGCHGSVVTSRCCGHLLKSAQLLPCSAAQVGEEWALVVRATWPPAQPGQLVSFYNSMRFKAM
jgi:hypothetical protein